MVIPHFDKAEEALIAAEENFQGDPSANAVDYYLRRAEIHALLAAQQPRYLQ